MVDLARTDAYDYPLPDELIARYPARRRDESRLLVVPPGSLEEETTQGSSVPFRHLRFSDLPELLTSGDLLVLNESRVLPVRLLGRKPTGAAVEVLLLRPAAHGDPTLWEALVRPGSKLKPGREVLVPGPEGETLRLSIVDGLPHGGRLVRLHLEGGNPGSADSGAKDPEAAVSGDMEGLARVEEALERFGRIPLPPYLEREAEGLDRERYQTVYARHPGSVAAPTAGLHFTRELLAEVEARGVETARVTLHVGPGTFRPVEAERVTDHQMHRERWEVPPETARSLAQVRERGGRVWAVGTTVVRTLESAADPDGQIHPGAGETRLFIAPGYRFRVVDGLITNFHLPRSTLLMLVAALAGHRTVMGAYREAVRERYRFYSYGDAMIIPPAD